MMWEKDEENNISNQNKSEDFLSNSIGSFASASSSDLGSSFGSDSPSGFGSSFGSASSSEFGSSFGSDSPSGFGSSFGSASSSEFGSSFGAASPSEFGSSFGSASSSEFDSSFGSGSSSEFDSSFGSGSSVEFGSSFGSDSSIGSGSKPDLSSRMLGSGSLSNIDTSSLSGTGNDADWNSSLNFSETVSSVASGNLNETMHDNTFPKRNGAEFEDELPDVKAALNPMCMQCLEKYSKNNNRYDIALAGVGLFFLTMIFIIIAKITNITFLDVIPAVTFLGCLGLFALNMILGVNNAYIADKVFKNEVVLQELKKYIDHPKLMDSTSEITISDYSERNIEDLCEIETPETILCALKLADLRWNKCKLKEWIDGTYHGMSFRFYETVLSYEVTVDKSTNCETVYSGQGYIFRTQVELPFPIQYTFNTKSSLRDLVVEKFEEVFIGSRYYYSNGVSRCVPKMKLSDDELEVFKIIEFPEFIVCLLKLAKIFYVYKYQQDIPIISSENTGLAANGAYQGKSDPNIINDSWCIRLVNRNIAIMRQGSFDYFEINIGHPLMDEMNKLEKEMTELLSVLNTMNSLTLISGKEVK